MHTSVIGRISVALIALGLSAATARAELPSFPVLVPITGFLSLEGTAQRNGAVLALEADNSVNYEVSDTGSSPEVAVNAMERALRDIHVAAIIGPILGTQMLAMLPLAEEYEVPLVTISGTARLTEMGNPWIFRFFPGDAVTKVAHARYVVEELGRRRPAILYQTTAYGQSGRGHLEQMFRSLGAEPVYQEGLDVSVKDMTAALAKAMAAKPDVLVLHMHSGPTALFVRQARAHGIGLPIVAGSAMHQPTTAALLEPSELKDVCAETGSSPISGGSPEMERFTSDYREEFGSDPDAFALAQYDATRMLLVARHTGPTGGAPLRDWLASHEFRGLAMTYKSDGKGNMAHDAVIVCYDGKSRTPRIAKRYEGVDLNR
ncbi:MAG: ABC transporter substrate-binding protein [Alphaproteobacteria bacterium]|nr:ABC transporter substrate-binding protein [Alphaproteobacteria bacterium]